MITVYGLRNCDTCRRARAWLEGQEIAHEFLDLRRDGAGDVEQWIAACGHEALINRRGTTWRKLAEEERQNLDDARAAALIRVWPAVMKRPLFVARDRVLVGFSAATQSALIEVSRRDSATG